MSSRGSQRQGPGNRLRSSPPGLLLVELTLPKDANVYASRYQVYLPSKEELKKRLIEWSEETPEAE